MAFLTSSNAEAITLAAHGVLTNFPGTTAPKRPTMAVLWFELQYGSWALYLSTQPDALELVPSEFDYPNCAVGDLEETVDSPSADQIKELETFARQLASALPSNQSPAYWGVQIDHLHYATWQSGDFP